jgi:dihydroorotase
LLNDGALENYDTRLKLNPPLREEADRLKLIEAVVDGTIDAICSDHSPCTATEKDCEFDLAPFGAASLETAFAAAYEALVLSGKADLAVLIARFTSGPARVLNLPYGSLKAGTAGDVVLFNPETSWTVSPTTLFSKSGNNPLSGRTFKGRIQHAFVGGKEVFSVN